MTQDQMLQICLFRLEGYSIHKIADCIGFSAQAVSNFLSRLPRKNTAQKLPDIEHNLMMQICHEYLNGVPVFEVSQRTELSENQVLSVFWFISGKRIAPLRSCVYPHIRKWMVLNYQNLENFSTLIGENQYRLRLVLTGKKPMSEELRSKIKDITGLPAHLVSECGGNSMAKLMRRPE